MNFAQKLPLQMMSKRAGTLCCVLVVFFPVVFYSPKFLEYRYQKFVHNFPMPINCSQYIEEQRELAEFNQKLQWVSSRHFFARSSTLTEFILGFH